MQLRARLEADAATLRRAQGALEAERQQQKACPAVPPIGLIYRVSYGQRPVAECRVAKASECLTCGEAQIARASRDNIELTVWLERTVTLSMACTCTCVRMHEARLVLISLLLWIKPCERAGRGCLHVY